MEFPWALVTPYGPAFGAVGVSEGFHKVARTLIGELILRLQAKGLGEARKVITTLHDVEAAAKRLGKGGVTTWGATFQRNLDKLRLSPQEIRDIQASWIRLHRAMSQQKFAPSAKQSGMAQWKQMTLQHFAAVQTGYDKHAGIMETKTRSHAKRLSSILRAGFVAGGFYTGVYGGGLAIRGGLRASSERRREHFRQRTANIPEADREKIFRRSEALSARYPSVPVTEVMEMARNAYTLMGDADRAVVVLDRMVQSFVALQSARGVDAAVAQLVGLLRGLDNLGVNDNGRKGIEQVLALIDAATKAAQVDPDFDPGKFFQFAKGTKVAGPALSPDFLARASVYMQDMGSAATGKAIAMAFKAFVLEAVGSAGGKKYLAERDRLGIRNGGELVDKGMFGSNPDQWVIKHLIPALKKDGVDLTNNTAIAAAVGKLSGNTNATAFLTRVITQRQQIERWLRLMDNAVGTDKADQVRQNDPFVSWAGFKSSLENLSAALIPIDSITSGLNSLTDGINKLAGAAEDNPFLTALGMGAAGYGVFKGGKWAGGKLADAFGLKSSAIALDGSAAALTRAAVALHGGAVGGAGGKQRPSKAPGKLTTGLALGSLFGLAGRAVPYAGAGLLAWEFLAPKKAKVAATKAWAAHLERHQAQIGARNRVQQGFIDYYASKGSVASGPPGRYSRGAWRTQQDEKQLRARDVEARIPFSKPINVLAEAEARLDVDGIQSDAATAGAQVKDALSVTARPNVDTSSLREALQLARAILATLRQIPGAMSAVDQNFGAEMRRNFSD